MNLIHGDCTEILRKFESNFIDLTITSPPYDNLRNYNNNILWTDSVWKNVISELYRVTKKGGVVVWVVGDETFEGSESGTSFKQALWAKECGFNLHDTMIYQKFGCKYPDKHRYYQIFEYMFVFSKGKPEKFNLIKDRINVEAGRKTSISNTFTKNGTKQPIYRNSKIVQPLGVRFNIWKIKPTQKANTANHPAVFPFQLAYDHIVSWSEENDMVLDPFMGSGTTGVACKKLNRFFIGIELNREYYETARNRIKSV